MGLVTLKGSKNERNGALFLSLIGKHLEHHNHQHHEARQKPDDSVRGKNISFLGGDELTFADSLWIFCGVCVVHGSCASINRRFVTHIVRFVLFHPSLLEKQRG